MAAKIIKENLENTRIERITADTCKEYYPEPGDTIGVVFPVLCGNAPEIVRRFVKKLILGKDVYFFGIATHGGHKVIACEQIAQILNEKGHKNYGMFDVEMVHNGAFVAPLPDEDSIKKVNDEAYKNIQEIAKFIDKKTICLIPDAEDIILHIAEKPMAKMVVFSFDPNKMGKTYFLNGECVKCGICAKVCPVNNIKVTDNGPIWGDKCEMCMACLQWCPKKIIQFSKTDIAEHTSVGNGRYHNPDISLADIITKGAG